MGSLTRHKQGVLRQGGEYVIMREPRIRIEDTTTIAPNVDVRGKAARRGILVARFAICSHKRRLTRRVWSFPLATTSVEAQGAAVLYLNHPDPKNRSRIQEVNRLC